jgi:HAD superfamily hydrolase (TIGR01490 family)
MSLALFDLDNTLLSGDSDYLWGQFLCDRGIVDRADYEATNQRFYDDYRDGRLDIMAFLDFSLAPLAAKPRSTLDAWHADFMAEKIEPLIGAAAEELVQQHRDAGDTLLIITATNSFVTAPIAARFGVPHLIATEPEVVDGRFTGRVSGTPSFRDGKVSRLREWLAQRHENLDGAWFYSDSQNDLPLLELVSHPVAVDPDPKLRSHAERKGWPILTLAQQTAADDR